MSNIHCLALDSLDAIKCSANSSPTHHHDVAHSNRGCLHESSTLIINKKESRTYFYGFELSSIESRCLASLHRKVLVLPGTTMFRSDVQSLSSDMPALLSNQSSISFLVATSIMYADLTIKHPFFSNLHDKSCQDFYGM